jgi:protein phosphatase
MKPIEVRSAGLSDTGLLRSDNQDQYFVADLTRCMHAQSGSLGIEPGSHLFGSSLGHLFFVADGMGGHRAGNEASMLAIEYYINAILNSTHWQYQQDPNSRVGFVEHLKSILLNAHRAIQTRAEGRPESKGMGTTLTLAYVVWPDLFVVHAGDTRCYVLHGEELRLLTDDHTVANQMLRSGQLNPNTVERSPWSNVLVNALGADAEQVFAEVHHRELQAGDALLLCSDGLNKHVPDIKIQELLNASATPEDCCKELIEMAKREGGSDNITAIVARFIETERGERLRMQVSVTPAAAHRILLDMESPPEEVDTSVTDEYFAAEFDEGKDTSDFPDGHETAEFFPKD